MTIEEKSIVVDESKIIELKETVEKSKEDTTPYPVVKDDNMAVIGDANKTEVKKHDFSVDFMIPNAEGEYELRTVEYKDVFLKPRHAVTVQRLMTSLMPLFYKVKPDGKLEDYSDEEMQEVADMYEGNVLGQIYYLVGAVLGIDDRIIEWAVPDSIIEAFHRIMKFYPELVKASDSFFGSSSGKKTTPPSKKE